MSFAFTAAAIAVVGAGLSAYSASEQADSQQKAARFQAQIDANNAQIALQNRSIELQQGEQDVQRAMMERNQLIGRQRVALAANGVDMNEGSAQDLLATTEFLSEWDQANIKNNAARKAWGFQVEQDNHLAEAGFNQWKAKQANPAKAGAITGFSSLLSSATPYAISAIKSNNRT